MPLDLTQIHPVVLVGGQSRRFGRDKLREVVDPAHDRWLIDQPINALRDVFGPRVRLVGDCDRSLHSRADGIIPDPYPGTGPLGGILASLEITRAGVFILSGDLAAIEAVTIRAVLDASSAAPPDSLATQAFTDRPEPCIALYRQPAAAFLRERLAAGKRALHNALPASRVQLVPIDPAQARNVNRPADLSDRA